MTDSPDARPARPAPPEELILHRAARDLEVVWSDGTRHRLPAEMLRVHAPSADVQGHNRADRKLVAGKGQVALTSVEPVGRYAVRLVFDDGHDTGIYSWGFLRDLGETLAEKRAAYLAELAAAGLSR